MFARVSCKLLPNCFFGSPTIGGSLLNGRQVRRPHLCFSAPSEHESTWLAARVRTQWAAACGSIGSDGVLHTASRAPSSVSAAAANNVHDGLRWPSSAVCRATCATYLWCELRTATSLDRRTAGAGSERQLQLSCGSTKACFCTSSSRICQSFLVCRSEPVYYDHWKRTR